MSGPEKDHDLNSFHSLMLRLEGGALNEELTAAVKKCVQEIADACTDRGGVQKSTITLKLEFKMDQKDKVVEIQATVDEKHPKAPRGRAGLFFCDSNGHLTRENPRQLTLDDELSRQRSQRERDAAAITGHTA